MPTNVTYEYQNAEKKFHNADTIEEKLAALREMLSTGPRHKGGENLRADIKRRISKYKELIQKQKKQRKGAKLGIKKEGAAQVVIIGKTNSGKSLLLKKLTNANVDIQEYEFTTVKPEIGVMDYNGIKVQVIEIPAITENFVNKENGPRFMGIIRGADLVILLYRDVHDLDFLLKEIRNAEIETKSLQIFNNDKGINIAKENVDEIKKLIWSNLDLIYVYTKMPGKEKDFPPVAMKKGESLEDLAAVVHKDFVKRFKFARIWGPSAKFSGAHVGLTHILEEGDVIEFHLK